MSSEIYILTFDNRYTSCKDADGNTVVVTSLEALTENDISEIKALLLALSDTEWVRPKTLEERITDLEA